MEPATSFVAQRMSWGLGCIRQASRTDGFEIGFKTRKTQKCQLLAAGPLMACVDFGPMVSMTESAQAKALPMLFNLEAERFVKRASDFKVWDLEHHGIE